MRLAVLYKIESKLHIKNINESNENKYNLFSDNIEDVKLSVEFGEDAN
jgi:hypothetical protein